MRIRGGGGGIKKIRADEPIGKKPPAKPKKPTGKKPAKPKDDGIRKVRADTPLPAKPTKPKDDGIRKVRADTPVGDIRKVKANLP
jgi:hypothetical protein